MMEHLRAKVLAFLSVFQRLRREIRHRVTSVPAQRLRHPPCRHPHAQAALSLAQR